MILIPKAKPVRIRIISGNQEHTTLDSLRKNFVWNDIKKVLDGRLIKWLKRINENDIAAELQMLDIPLKFDELSDTKELMLQIYNVIFRKSYISEDDVFSSYINDSSIEPLVKELVDCKKIDELIILGNSYQEIASIIAKRVFQLIESYDNEIETVLLFEAGKFLYEKSEFKDFGKNCILKAAKKELREASDYKKANFKNETLRLEDLLRVLNDDETKKDLEDSWRSHTKLYLDEQDIAKKELYAFSNACIEIYCKIKNFSGTKSTLRDSSFDSYIKEQLKAEKDDFLYNEKIVVLSFFSSRGNALSILRGILNYPLAKELFDNDCTSDGRFVLNKIQQNADNLGYFINNLLTYRNIERNIERYINYPGYREINDIVNSKTVKDVLKRAMDNNNTIKLEGISGAKRYLYEFFNIWLNIRKLCSQPRYSIYDLKQHVIKEIGDLKNTEDPLYYEKTFLIALFEPLDKAKTRLNKIIKNYLPAQHIYNKGKLQIGHYTIEPNRMFTIQSNLYYYLTNLIKYRKND